MSNFPNALCAVGYPVDTRAERINSVAAHVGTVSLFASAGFALIGETKARSDGKPRWHMRLDLKS